LTFVSSLRPKRTPAKGEECVEFDKLCPLTPLAGSAYPEGMSLDKCDVCKKIVATSKERILMSTLGSAIMYSALSAGLRS
jgi:hypothetical protein